MQEQESTNQSMDQPVEQQLIGQSGAKPVDQPMQIGEPKKKPFPLIITLLSVLATGGIGFGIYGMLSSSSNTIKADCSKCAESEMECPKCQNCEEKECPEPGEKTTLDKALVKVAMEHFVKKKSFGGIKTIGEPYPSTIAKMMDDENLKMLYAAYQGIGYEASQYVYYNNFNSYFKSYFGYDAPKQNFGGSGFCIGYNYDEKLDKFIPDKNAWGCGGADPTIENYFIEDWRQDGNDVIINSVLIQTTDVDKDGQIVTFIDGSTASLPCNYNAGDKMCSDAINQAFADENSSRLPHFILTLSRVEDHFIIKSASIEE